MKKDSVIRVITFILCFTHSFIAVGQGNMQKVSNVSPNLLQERIFLNTDRFLYVTNEKIKISAAYSTHPTLDTIAWSKVLYLELISSDGTSFHQSRHRLDNNLVSCEITIPETLRSGNYFLKAYTRWMRNFPASEYGYKMIKIVNPALAEIVLVEMSAPVEDSIPSSVFREANTSDDIEIFTDKRKYGVREPVHLNIKHDIPSSSEHFLSVTVTKKGALDNSFQTKHSPGRPQPADIPVIYMPELYGNTISGITVNTLDSKPLAGADVSLAIPNDTAFFTQTKSIENGYFYINIPDNEGEEIVFLESSLDTTNTAIKMHNDFCRKQVFLDADSFQLTAIETETLKEISVNAQLQSKYQETNLPASAVLAHEISFYGIPDITYETKDYIDIPTLDEFIFEIIGEISITKNRGTSKLSVSQLNTFQMYPLLVMVDHLPVHSLQNLLEMSMRRIEKVEIVNHPYVIGDYKYSGIIHVFTKAGNIPESILSPNSIFAEIQMFYGSKQASSIPISSSAQSRIPDRRITLFWEPQVKLKPKNEAAFTFRTSDVTGEFEVKVFGFINRVPVYSSTYITVVDE